MSAWYGGSDTMVEPPSFFTTGICTSSVFEGFEFDAQIPSPDSDEYFQDDCMKSESDCDVLNNPKVEPLGSMFPDLMIDLNGSDSAFTNINIDDDLMSPMMSPTSSPMLSSTSSPMLSSTSHPMLSSTSSPFLSSYSMSTSDAKYKLSVKKEIEKLPTFPMYGLNGSNERSSIDSGLLATLKAVSNDISNAAKNDTSLNAAKNDIKKMVASSLPPIACTVPTITTTKSGVSSIIRLPVKQSGQANIGNTSGSRRLKALVVCPDRSKSIVCNVVRSNHKGIVIQKPVVNRSWLNVSGSIRNESTKLPIKVNVITSKENGVQMKSLIKSQLPVCIKQEPTSVLTTPTANVSICRPVLIPVNNINIKAEELNNINIKAEELNNINIKVEELDNINIEAEELNNIDIKAEEFSPESAQNFIGLDGKIHPFSLPKKEYYFEEKSNDELLKTFLMDDDNMCDESYRCVPLSAVTGHMQPVIPDIFKYTPNSSPNNNGDSVLDLFYPKLSSSDSGNYNQFYNKAAANVDHDYGFTCRAPKSTNSNLSFFNADSLGIQTPSASEPPTDSDDDDDCFLGDITLLNKDFDCKQLDREQSEYFEHLKHQLKLAEEACKPDEKDSSLSNSTNIKERKPLGRNRKRKLSREKNVLPSASKTTFEFTNSDDLDSIVMRDSENISANCKTLKMRLPVRDGNAKKKKNCSGGRIFSPSERHLHNTNEQVRRIEMRDSFEELRKLIPNLYDKLRAPKVSILQEAKSYCDTLFTNDLRFEAQKTALKCHQERLRCTLSRLRKCAAASRY